MSCYNNIGEFREALLEYLNSEKQYIEEDIKENNALPDTEKIEKGLLIDSVIVAEGEFPYYNLKVSENNTKLRPGDAIILRGGKHKIRAKVVENTDDVVSVEIQKELSSDESYRLEVSETVLLDSIISLTETIADGGTGAHWVRMLAGIDEPRENGFSKIVPRHPIDYGHLNTEQRVAVENTLKRPSLYCIQGPPGTGKTDVLSAIARAYADDQRPKEVLVLSNTHQAVNNALNKIREQGDDLHITKIGEPLKAEGLDDTIYQYPTFREYLRGRKKRTSNRDIVGMTFHAAVVNLGLRDSSFCPAVAIVDEASLMPFVFGVLLGIFGCSTTILIGDDRQMPSIFHEKLVNNPFSVSLFENVSHRFEKLKTVFTTTYRMNDEITQFVSSRFYEPYGIRLVASDYSHDRSMHLKSHHEDERIRLALSDRPSIVSLDVSEHDCWEDYNQEEAAFIASLVKEALVCGLRAEDIAVVTPYRRQVKTIRENVKAILKEEDNIPLIDTVERMQGQSVEMVILSMSITNSAYYEQQSSFILEPHRLNVMISRAKCKVVLIGKYNEEV